MYIYITKDKCQCGVGKTIKDVINDVLGSDVYQLADITLYRAEEVELILDCKKVEKQKKTEKVEKQGEAHCVTTPPKIKKKG